MKSDREIQRFADGLETFEEYFYTLHCINRKFNAWNTVLTEEDIQVAFRNAVGRDITEPEFSLLIDRCDAMLEAELDKVAMELLERFCRNSVIQEG